MKRVALPASLVALLVAVLGVAAADADRRATSSERKAIAKVVDLPAKCAKARVSTAVKRPKWASVYWKPGGERCEPFARDGAAVLKRRDGKWRFVTAGSDFDCPRLYRDVPRRVVEDLDLPCH
jgi:hypothetical protein